MKKTYIIPSLNIVKIEGVTSMLAGSDLGVGNAYGNGDVVLSRQGGDLWDDED